MENEWGDDPFQSMVDAVALIQGSQMADSALLFAMLISHPDPHALLDAWRRVTAPKLARQSTKQAIGGQMTTADRDYAQALQRWTARIEELVALKPPRTPPAE